MHVKKGHSAEDMFESCPEMIWLLIICSDFTVILKFFVPHCMNCIELLLQKATVCLGGLDIPLQTLAHNF